MSQTLINILAGFMSLGAGVMASILFFNKKKIIDIDKKRATADEMVEKSKEEANEIKEESKKHSQERKEAMEKDAEKRKERMTKREEGLTSKEEILKKREERVNEVKLKIASYKEETQSKQDGIERMGKEVTNKLTEKTGEKENEVKEEILQRYRKELAETAKQKLASEEEALKENAKKQAESILVSTIQRLSSPTSVETRAVIIKVPKDYIKGKIVGKEGQNIKEVEDHLDVAIVFNDLPNAISVSAFNLVTRAIAERTLRILIQHKGDISPAVVRGTIEKAKHEIDEELFIIGKDALAKMGITSSNKEFTQTIGKLQYRTSYGQNIMKHSMEVGWLATMLGSELGLDIKTCKIAGFLHDLGKAIDQDPDIKDAHDQLTKELMEKFNLPEAAIHAAWTHHDAAPQETPEALVVKAADSISGGRPGARQDSIERYIERMQAIEETVHAFEGVKKSYIMSAGREVRVYVDPEKITDGEITGMAEGIAKDIEQNVVYPGKIKIRVVRRTKSLEIAR